MPEEPGQMPITPPQEGITSIETVIPDPAPPKTYDEAYVKELRAEAAANRVKLRELTAAEAARQSAADAKALAELPEIERLKTQLELTEKKAKALEVQSIRTKAAAKHALPEDLLEFLTAEDEEGALAQAAKLAERLKAAGLPAAGGRNPANANERGSALDQNERLKQLAQRVPALNNRVVKGN